MCGVFNPVLASPVKPGGVTGSRPVGDYRDGLGASPTWREAERILREMFLMVIIVSWEGAMATEPDSHLWCPGVGEEQWAQPETQGTV